VTLSLRVKSVTWEAPNILSYDLRPAQDAQLPPFTAGAHIDLALPSGLMRSYSLVNSQSERVAAARSGYMTTCERATSWR
jgi:ferredoxin-NADP reductase